MPQQPRLQPLYQTIGGQKISASCPENRIDEARAGLFAGHEYQYNLIQTICISFIDTIYIV